MSFVPSGYKVKVTQDRVPGIEPALRTRFERRAIRRRNDLNVRRDVPFYRWEVVQEAGHWWVIAFQNELMEKKKRAPKPETPPTDLGPMLDAVMALATVQAEIAVAVKAVQDHLQRFDQAGSKSIDVVKEWSEELATALESRFDDVDRALRLAIGE